MTGSLIATTEKASAHALAYQGIMIYSSFPQIRDMIRRKFGDEYVLLFAEPVENTQTGQIDWYTPVQGKARKLGELESEAREKACSRAREMATDIAAYAEELIHSPDPLKVTRGHILRLALRYPDEDCLYAVGEQPVFIGWGFGPGRPGVEPADLTRLAFVKKAAPASVPPVERAVPPPPEEKPTVAPVAGRPVSWAWLWWLLPLLAAALLALFLFTSFGGAPPLAGKTLFRAPALFDKPVSRSDELAALQGEVDELRARAEKRAALCVPQPKPAPVAEAPAPKPAPGGVRPPVAEPGAGLVIPKKAEDASFLAGKWLCDTGLANMRTGEPVEVLFEFGPDGRGKAAIIEKDDRCIGDANARMRDGELDINVTDLECDNSGASYQRMNIVCRDAGAGSSICEGASPGGKSWSARFKKTN